MKKKILEYIDFDRVNTLLEGFNQSTGFVTAILDLEGNILSKSGWRKICTEFHRINPDSSQKCLISDTILAGEMKKGEQYHCYKCLNGLVDVAVPIVIKGEHIANLFSGQFFFEKPDTTFFQNQAVNYGFNESVYLKALEEVPIISEDKVKVIIDFLLNMTQMISDITFQKMELMELNETLRTNEDRHRLVLENSMDAILLTSPDGTILSANPAACRMFQRSEEEICQLGRDAITDMSDPRIPILIEERIRTGKAKGELQMLRKDGTKFPVELSTSVFTDQSGRILSSMIIHDITDRKNFEQQLLAAKEIAEESERHFRLLVENAPEAIFIQVDSKFAYLNKAAVYLYGASYEEQLLGTSIIDRIHPESIELVEQRIKQINQDKLAVTTAEYKHLKLNNSVIEVSVSAVPFKFQNKNGALVFVRDITDRKSAEELYKQKNEELNTFFDCALDLLGIASIDGSFIRLNKEWENVLGYDLSELENSKYLDYVHPDDMELSLIVMKQLSEHKISNFTNRYRCKNGDYKWIEWKSYPIGNKVYVAARDISERMQQKQDLIRAKEKIEKSEELFKKAFYTIPEAITINRIETGTYISVNNGFKKMLEYSEEEVIGHSSIELNIWEHISDRINFINALKKDGLVESLEAKFRTKTGKIIDCLVSSTVIEIDNIPHILSITRDISYRKKVENELRESKEQLKFAFEGSNDGLWDVNMNTGQVYINSRGCEILGFSPSEMEFVAKIWSDLVHPDDLALTNSNLQAHLENKTPIFEVEQRLRTKSGEWKWILSRGKVVSRDANGKPLRMTGTHTDISERIAFKEALIRKNMELAASEEEIRASNEQLLSTYDNLKQSNIELELAKEKAEENEKQFSAAFYSHPFPLSIVSIPEGRILDVNNACCEFYGYSRQKLLNFTTQELQIWDNELNREKALNELASTGRLRLLEVNAKIASNEFRTILLSAESIIWKGQKCFITSTIDITERKILELELVKAKEKAEESNRLKTAFLQNMSHEIRTPMNAIMGFSELLVLNFNDKTKLESFSKVINQRCNDLLSIINDILDIAKIESGQLAVNIEKCNLNSLFIELRALFSELQHRLNKQNITLSLPSQEPGLVFKTDHVKLKQILINLIGNAFKFTYNGKIEVGYTIEKNNIVFFVSDTGIGIPVEKQQLIFERFTQLEPATNRNYGGNGLGLSIVKGLIDLFGGKIWLESELNKGSTFYFSLPYEEESSDEKTLILEKEKNEYSFSQKNILLVEDDPYNTEFIKEVILNVGLHLQTTQFGKEAIQIAASQPIDLILMDIGLPDINGYEAVQQILKLKPSLKIIAQTAYAASSDKKKALDSGCIDYISKPLKVELLVSLLHKYLK